MILYVRNWFLTIKMIKKFHNAIFTDDDKLFLDGDCVNVTISADEMDVLGIDLNINLDDVDFNKNRPETIIHVRLMV